MPPPMVPPGLIRLLGANDRYDAIVAALLAIHQALNEVCPAYAQSGHASQIQSQIMRLMGDQIARDGS